MANAPGRLFPPWSTYLAVLLYTRSIGSSPFEFPLVPAMYEPRDLSVSYVYLYISVYVVPNAMDIETDASGHFRDHSSCLQSVINSFN